MPLITLRRAALLVLVTVATVLLIIPLAPGWGFRSLIFAAVPVALTGWLAGMTAGGIAGLLLISGALWGPLTEGLQRPNLDQLLLLSVLALLGPSFGAFAALKRGHDRHRQASAEARFDPLTGLRNRTAFSQELAEMLEHARRTDTQVAVLFIDLDRFKIVNDTFGHAAGDMVLAEVAQRMLKGSSGQELTGRLGGDEFVLAVPGVDNVDALSSRARKLLASLGRSIELDGTRTAVGASIGISIFPADGETPEALIKFADSAMYQVKSGGKNYFRFSTDDMRQQRNRQLELERCLRNAMSSGEFSVRYQPQVDLRSLQVVGFEALLRWDSVELGEVSPEEFVPIAEETGLIIPLGHWLLREVCQQSASWRKLGLPAVRLAVNVSPVQFSHPEFINQVKQAARDAGMLPNSLELEITEGILLQDNETVMRTLRRLRRLEIRVTLDDFGTGYSSLAYLERLPIASLKIPQTFVAGTGDGLPRSGMSQERSRVITQAICAMAHKLSKTVIAEGIEHEGQLRFLREIGVDYGQGFMFGAALEVNEAEQLQRSQLERPRPRRSRQSGLMTNLLVND